MSCEQEPGPENTLYKWLTCISRGECDKAIDLEIEYSMAPVILENCDPYASEIKSIICEKTEEVAACSCIEIREFGQERHSSFDLKKVDGNWQMLPIH